MSNFMHCGRLVSRTGDSCPDLRMFAKRFC